SHRLSPVLTTYCRSELVRCAAGSSTATWLPLAVATTPDRDTADGCIGALRVTAGRAAGWVPATAGVSPLVLTSSKAATTSRRAHDWFNPASGIRRAGVRGRDSPACNSTSTHTVNCAHASQANPVSTSMTGLQRIWPSKAACTSDQVGHCAGIGE